MKAQIAGAGVVWLAAMIGTSAPSLAVDNVVKIDGSSTVYPVTEAVAEDFQNSKKGAIKVTVGISGTGGGFKKFTRGETDISNASRPILKKEMDDAKANGVEYIELPICFDALTVVINPQNTWAKTMTVAELKKIWEPAAQGKITMWNQVRPDWPAEEIKLFGAGTDSGTFDYFTEAICGKSKASRGDFTASEDDNVLVRGVEGSKFALGYFGYAYYAPHAKKLTAVAIDNGKGGVIPSKESVLTGDYNPLSRPLFIYVNRKSVESKPFVREFVDFYLKNVKKLSEEVKYVPLPDSAYEAIGSRWAKLETGTVFAGHEAVGLKIDEIVKKELTK
ncbi:MAG: PstS family phosphate ABC transporter substrate-binding protein [Phycisphaerales bacterium]